MTKLTIWFRQLQDGSTKSLLTELLTRMDTVGNSKRN